MSKILDYLYGFLSTFHTIIIFEKKKTVKRTARDLKLKITIMGMMENVLRNPREVIIIINFLTIFILFYFESNEIFQSFSNCLF